MLLIINGERKSFPETVTLEFVIQDLKIEDKVMAAAVNMSVVKKEEWHNCLLKDQDNIELLHFVGGG